MEEEEKKKFIISPQGKSNTFRKYWRMFIPQITDRKNTFNGHREQVIILCNLYEEYHILSKFIKENGYSQIISGRYGEQIKKWPEVEQRNFVIKEIRVIMKTMGLEISTDIKPSDTNEWT
jgi:phage terminase small subunit